MSREITLGKSKYHYNSVKLCGRVTPRGGIDIKSWFAAELNEITGVQGVSNKIFASTRRRRKQPEITCQSGPLQAINRRKLCQKFGLLPTRTPSWIRNLLRAELTYEWHFEYTLRASNFNILGKVEKIEVNPNAVKRKFDGKTLNWD